MTDLITRLTESEGANRDLDRDIAIYFHPHSVWLPGGFSPPGFTDPQLGIAVCIALAEKVLPKEFIGIEGISNDWHVQIMGEWAQHKSLCHAFLIAIIKAKEEPPK